MTTVRDNQVTASPRNDSWIYEGQAASAHGSVRTLLAMVVSRLVILTTVAALVALVVVVAS